jgi:hypothetical protein
MEYILSVLPHWKWIPDLPEVAGIGHKDNPLGALESNQPVMEIFSR